MVYLVIMEKLTSEGKKNFSHALDVVCFHGLLQEFNKELYFYLGK